MFSWWISVHVCGADNRVLWIQWKLYITKGLAKSVRYNEVLSGFFSIYFTSWSIILHLQRTPYPSFRTTALAPIPDNPAPLPSQPDDPPYTWRPLKSLFVELLTCMFCFPISDHVIVPDCVRACLHNDEISWRTSRGLYWESKKYKLKRYYVSWSLIFSCIT